ncbi:MAG: ATP-binding protein [Candidatus Hydrothermarchaeales archaeon]
MEGELEQRLKEHSERVEQKVDERTRELESSYKELSLLHEVNSALNAGMDLEEILQIIIDGMTSVFNYFSSGIYLLSRDGKYLVVKNYSLDSRIIEEIERLIGSPLKGYKIPLYEGSIFRAAMENKEPIITHDIVAILKEHTDKKGLRALAKAVAKLTGLKSGVGVPLVAGDKVVGMLGVASRDQEMSERDAERLMSFADQAGLAIERAKLYEELKEYSEQLERKVEERTRELRKAQQQLIQSEKLAAIGQLAAGVAHEINNPLTNILLDAELLHQKALEGDLAKERLEEIISQVGTVARITRNLLEFARQSEVEIKSLDITALLEKSLEMLSFQLTNIRLEKDFQPNLPELRGDSSQLQQVFLNIITNAIQAMPDGGRLGISIVRENGFIRVDISDTGLGIAEEDLGKIFDPFYTTKGVGGGTGLGLSICLGIVERHGGDIRVESKVDKGSTFTVRLPIGE